MSKEEFEVWLESCKDEVVEQMDDQHASTMEWCRRFSRSLSKVAYEYADDDSDDETEAEDNMEWNEEAHE